MKAVSGTRRTLKEMADGTIRVQIDIDQNCRAAFLEMFPSIDLPVAIAPLVADFDRRQERVEEHMNKGGALAKLAGMWCNEQTFREWASNEFDEFITSPELAAEFIRMYCGVESRADLDHNAKAAKRFSDGIRIPYSSWLKANG